MPGGSGWFNTTTDGVQQVVEFHKGIAPTRPFGLFIFDDFLDKAAIDTKAVFDQLETGTGTSHAVFVNSATSNGGYCVGVAGATSANAQEIAGQNVGWKASTMGPLFIEVRGSFVGTTTAADGDHFIGFSDVVTATSGLSYDISLTSTVTATGVTEGAMVGYSSIPTSGALHPASGNNYYGFFTTKATVAATPGAGTALAKKDSNMHVYRVVVDASGNCTFSMDGVVIGAATAAVTAATAVTPYVNVIGRNSHANTATLDYILCGALTRV